MAIKEMTTTRILMIFSLFFAAFGITAGALLIILKFPTSHYLLIGLLVFSASFLLSTLVRMFANIGQMVFDLRHDNYNSINRLAIDIREFSRSNKEGIQSLVQSNKEGIQSLVQSNKEGIQYLIRSLQAINSLNVNAIQESGNSTITSLQEFKDRLLAEMQCLKDLERFIFDNLLNELQILKSIFEQINCDSKDVNHHTNQIKDFFEKIERHLDLKK